MSVTLYLPEKGLFTRFAILLMFVGCLFIMLLFPCMLYPNQWRLEFFGSMAIDMFFMALLFMFIDRRWC